MHFVHKAGYEKTVMMAARVLLAIQFAVAAFFKAMGFIGEVGMTANVGVPFANVAVGAALVLEIIGVFSLLTGYKIRPVALLLALYVMLLAILFYNNWADQMILGLFVSHLGLTAALLCVSAGGAQHKPHHPPHHS